MGGRDALLAKIADRSASVGVIGLGYVGLPLALSFAHRGFSVLGFDIDSTKIESLARRDCYIKHLDPAWVESALAAHRFRATDNFDRLGEPDVLIICVPTPLTPQREPDMTYVIGTANQIKARLRRGQLVVLESTTYPGTTEGLLREQLEESGMIAGEDFHLAYSPEREDPGNRNHDRADIPKVVGGFDRVSGDLAEALYGAIVTRTVRVSSPRAAEATKLVENIFRAVNIALVNELKMVYDAMGVDIWETLDAAATKPFGFMRFDPGPGWGGHCIPLDPFYLSWKAREFGVMPKFVELAGEVNVGMPRYVVEKLIRALNERGKAVKEADILLLGIAYKKDVDDARESPAFELLDALLELDANVSYHDPHLPIPPSVRKWPHLPPLESVELTAERLSRADAVVVVTNHTDVDYELVAQHARLIIDTRGVFRERRVNVVKA